MARLKGEKLHEAIDSASESTVRSVLHGLCAESETEWQMGEVMAKVLQYSKSDKHKQASKRKPAAIQICGLCNQAFDEEDEEDDEKRKTCWFHPEESEVDEDGWPDHDEDCHAEIDTPEMRREYPDGFIVPCCDQRGNSKGCTEGEHMAVARKRGKH